MLFEYFDYHPAIHVCICTHCRRLCQIYFGINGMDNKTVAPDRRGRAAEKDFNFAGSIAIFLII